MRENWYFSNILLDLRRIMSAEVASYSDPHSDIAKLGHNIVGRCEQIVGEHLLAGGTGADFELSIPADPLRDWLEAQFLAASAGAMRFDDARVRATIVSLFLSMIPLHADAPERQRALFANGLRLFAQFFERPTPLAQG